MKETDEIEREVKKYGKFRTPRLSHAEFLQLDDDGYTVNSVGDCDCVEDEVSEQALHEKRFLSGEQVIYEIARAIDYAANSEYDSAEMKQGAMAVVTLVDNVLRYLRNS